MRHEFRVDNEANCFLLYTDGEGAPGRDWIVRNLPRAISDGQAVPVELVQDDSFAVRFVDEELSEQEQTEWVGMVEWNLRIPSGVLALVAGLEPGGEHLGEGAYRVEVSPGDYRVRVYSYLPGVNAWGCLRATGDAETLGEWFRRTRPDEAMPDWLVCRLAESPDDDPGHERVWEAFLISEGFAEAQRGAQAHPIIDFVVRLIPLAAGEDCRNEGRKGPKPAISNARKPALFPLGLISSTPAAVSQPDFIWRPQSPQVAHLLKTVPQAIPLTGDSSVPLRVETIHDLARIPAWCNELTWAILLIKPPTSVPGAALGIVPSFYVGLEETSVGLLVHLKPKDKLSICESIRELEKALASLPDDTVLECVWGDYAEMNDAGDQRYRGRLHNGVWTVEAAYPEMRGETLREAVEFAGHLDRGCVMAGSPEEAERVLRLCLDAWPDWAAAVQPRAEGAMLTLAMDDAGELWNMARFAFALRYSDTWDAWAWWKAMYPDIRPWEALG